MENIYLKDIRHELFPDESITDWDFVQGGYDDVRIYYKPKGEDALGFYFYAVENTSYGFTDQTCEDQWGADYCSVECILNGVSDFGGIRYLNYGAEQTHNYGCHHYPNLRKILDTTIVLLELESKYCYRMIQEP